MKMGATVLALVCAAWTLSTWAAGYPQPVSGDYVIHDFKFASGEALHEVKLHYVTIGTPARDDRGAVTNAVLLLHGTGGSGKGFLTDGFAGTLFGPGQPLDAMRYFIIVPDSIGHGASSKPSDGLHARFPRYVYDDMVRAQYRLMTEKLGVAHLRLIVGTSMGGMHAWMWAVTHPQFMDAVLPIVCLPVEITGRNRMQRYLITSMIRRDPEWHNGEYTQQPQSLAVATQIAFLGASGARQLYLEAPTQEAADKLLDETALRLMKATDANDFVYAWEASRGYNPSPQLPSITAAVTAINFADDDINPTTLSVFEQEVQRVPGGRAVLIPASDQTRGHRSFYVTALWKTYLEELLARSMH